MSKDVRRQVSDTRARTMCQTAEIGSGIPWARMKRLGGTQTPQVIFEKI